MREMRERARETRKREEAMDAAEGLSSGRSGQSRLTDRQSHMSRQGSGKYPGVVDSESPGLESPRVSAVSCRLDAKTPHEEVS